MVKKNEEKMKVRIPSKQGKIEIEGTIDDVQKLLNELGVNTEEKQKNKKGNEEGGTIEDQILSLIESEFFDEPKTLPEIREELEKRGYHYPSSSLYPVLLRKFIRKDIIERKGERGSYEYYVSGE